MYPKMVTQEMHLTIKQIYLDYSDDINANKMFVEISREKLKNEIYVYY